MARMARIVAPGEPHHITQRGNNRQDVFFVDDDRAVYLRLLKEQSAKYGLSVFGYCLMTNHVHLVATPQEEKSLAKAVGRTHFLYTRYVNRLHGRSGHLWQNRFFSCPVDEGGFWRVMCYVERNPVRAKMVRKPWSYAWSSAQAHVSGNDVTGSLDMAAWTEPAVRINWKETLVSPEDQEELRQIRLKTRTGRPLASDSFVSKLEGMLGRRIRPLPGGRPKKGRRQKTR